MHHFVFYRFYILDGNQPPEHPDLLSNVIIHLPCHYFTSERCLQHIKGVNGNRKPNKFNFIVRVFNRRMYQPRKFKFS